MDEEEHVVSKLSIWKINDLYREQLSYAYVTEETTEARSKRCPFYSELIFTIVILLDANVCYHC